LQQPSICKRFPEASGAQRSSRSSALVSNAHAARMVVSHVLEDVGTQKVADWSDALTP